MAADGALAYLPPEKRYPFCANFAAKSAQKKNPLAEVKLFYHIREDLSSFFRYFLKIYCNVKMERVCGTKKYISFGFTGDVFCFLPSAQTEGLLCILQGVFRGQWL